MCLQGTCQQQLWCLYMLLKQVSPYRSANLVPFLQLTNTWRACVRTWSGTCGGAARRQRGTPSAAPGSRTQNPRRKTKVAHSSVWDRLMGVMVETPCFIECNTIELFVHIFWKMNVYKRLELGFIYLYYLNLNKPFSFLTNMWLQVLPGADTPTVSGVWHVLMLLTAGLNVTPLGHSHLANVLFPRGRFNWMFLCSLPCNWVHTL